MKKSTIIATLIAFCTMDGFIPYITAQSNHWPSDGDKLEKTHYEYVDIAADSLLWDFSSVIATGSSHTMAWSNIGDSILVKRELGAQSTYNVVGDSVMWNAYESPLFELRGLIAPVVNIRVAMPDTVTLPYSYHGTYCGNNYMLCEGLITFSTSAEGTLILPDDTIKGAIRTTQRAVGTMRVADNKYPFVRDSINLHMPINHIVVVDRWYAPDYRYELAETVSDRYYFNDELIQESAATFLCQPAEQEYSLSTQRDKTKKQRSARMHRQPEDDATYSWDSSLTDNVAVKSSDNSIDVSVDTKSFPTTEGGNTIKIHGLLCDQLGRVWERFNGEAVIGDIWQTTLQSQELPQGNYIMHIAIGLETVTKKLTIK